MDIKRWQCLMHRLQIPPSFGVYARLVAAYTEPHRHYHTTKHIQDCLQHFDQVRMLCKAPNEVELALWFHDIIYQPMSTHNEQDSADWAREFLEINNVEQDRCDLVTSYIMSTKHDSNCTGENVSSLDIQLITDIDLSVLGCSTQKYMQFEQYIRAEYQFVPIQQYCNKRMELLELFFNRPFIYATKIFREYYEHRAKHNLKVAINNLQHKLRQNTTHLNSFN